MQAEDGLSQRRRLITAAVACALLWAVCTAQAQLRFYEPFAYSAGTNILGRLPVGAPAGQTVWSADSGTPTFLVESPGMTYNGLFTQGNALSVQTGTASIHAGFTPTFTSGGIFFSFLLNVATAPMTTSLITLIGLANGTDTAMKIVISSDNPMGTYELGLFAGNRGSSFYYGDNPMQLSSNTTYFIVGEYISNSVGSASMNLWINPTNLGGAMPPPATLVSNVTTSSIIQPSVNNIYLYNHNADASVDEIRIGTSWADVTPVPEPGVCSLLASLGIAVASFRVARKWRR